jgi:hypothetical protein
VASIDTLSELVLIAVGIVTELDSIGELLDDDGERLSVNVNLSVVRMTVVSV